MVYLFDNVPEGVYFGLLLISILFLWLFPKISLHVAALAVGYGLYLERITFSGAAIIAGAVLLLQLFKRTDDKRFTQPVIFLALTALFMMGFMHYLPGFDHWLMIENYPISIDSYPYRFFLSSDKILFAILIAATTLNLAREKLDWQMAFHEAFLPTLLVCAALIPTVTIFTNVTLDPKMPDIMVLWMVINFFFVAFVEEAFFRGFVQRYLFKWLGLPWQSIFLSATLFGLMHYHGGAFYMGIATLAGVGYGIAYQRGQRLEAAIIAHFTVNLMHVLMFDYPGLLLSVLPNVLRAGLIPA
ncbi:MAG: lysostaphin resistance A-like protein [Alphaproteobacteria bacterium]